MKIKLGDIDVSYNIQGNGEPVVLIHGLAENKESWCGIQEKLRNCRTYSYDLRGHGESTLGECDGTLEQLGGDLISFLEKVSGPAQCVGYSLGGTLVLWAAAKQPELVCAAVVAGTSTVVGKQAVEFFEERIRIVQEDFSTFTSVLKKDTSLQIVKAALGKSGEKVLEDITARRLKAVGDGTGYVNAARAMLSLNKIPLTPILKEIQCHISIISGEKDIFCPRKAADIMVSNLTNSTFKEVTDSGHLLSVDQPETYAQAIQSALKIGEKYG
jgi:3-oxoadipate enol-lactonase